MHNGLMTSSSSPLYPIRYIFEPFLPYDSILEINILLTSMPPILNSFLFFLSPKFISPPPILILDKEKK